jgi:hypothetical protein
MNNNWIRKMLCWLGIHAYEKIIIYSWFTSTPAKSCKYCPKVK